MTDTSRALAELRPQATLPSPDEWSMITGMAKELIDSGFLPSTIQKPAQAAAVMLKGRELGIPPMYALSNINIIKGKPVANAELMMALVKRAYGPSAIWFEETDNKHAVVGYILPGTTEKRYYPFTITDATMAQLGGDNWKKYPAAMLRARCVSAVCRMAFPEVIAGMYSPGELGEQVIVNDDGEVMSADFNRAQPAPQYSAEIGTYEDDTPAGRMRPDPPTISAKVEVIDQDTGEVTDEPSRDDVVNDLQQALDANGYTEDDLEVYFDRAGIDPDTVQVGRLLNIAQGIRKNPVAFGEAVEKHRIQMQARLDPELNPSDEELGIR